MANPIIGILSLLMLSFYDPSLIIYRVGFVNEIALGLIGLLFIVNHRQVFGLLFLRFDKARTKLLYCAFWLLWGAYFFAHAALGLTSFGFASSRIVRVLFAVLFFLNIRSLRQLHVYLRILVGLACFYSITSCAFHLVTILYGAPAVRIVHIPVVDVDFADLGIFGYMWPTNYDFPMQINGITLYRISSYFNESAAFAFFLEPILFYTLYLRGQSRQKIGYTIVFLVVLAGLLASTSAAGSVAVLLSFLLLWLCQESSIIKRVLLAAFAILLVYFFYQSGIGALEDVLSSKQGTIDLETAGVERSIGLLHGFTLIVGTGYDFVRDDFYVSSNALLANLQRGGVIGLLLLLTSFGLLALQWLRIGIKNLLIEKRWIAFALLPNLVHLCIKVTYEFTFIYLINYSLVFWYLSHSRAKNINAVSQS